VSQALTARQQAILSFVTSFIENHGYAPSVRQIQQEVGASSTSVVTYNLDVLAGRGLLARKGRTTRTLALPAVSSRAVGAVPLVGALVAGQPLPQRRAGARRRPRMVLVPPSIAPATALEDVYALLLRGQGYQGALLADGDLVLLRDQSQAEIGDLIVATLGDEGGSIIMRYYPCGHAVRLQPTNATLPPQIVPVDHLRIHARIIGVLRGNETSWES
jgi:repressor LexA